MIEKIGWVFDMLNKSPSEYVDITSKDYAIYVAENRAIPKVTDGLKAAQRKALWLMRNKAEKVKTASLAGEMIQSGLYVHGDAPAAEAVSALAAPYINNLPLLEGKGTFGTRVAPSAWGAARYTYVKRSKVAQELLYKDLDIVPLVDNYDGSTKEPDHFLPLVPIVLLNGISGIAVGWSSEILPHKLEDLVDACTKVLQGKKVPELIPTYSKFNIRTKRIEGNSWEFSGMVDIVDTSTARVIELPADLSLEKFKSKLDDLEDQGKIKSYIDKSTSQINVTIKFKKGSIKGWSEEKLLNLLKLKSKKTQRIIVIDWNGTSIRQYERAEELVKDFVEWRLTWHRKRFENLLANARDDLNFYRALEECFKQKLPEQILTLKTRKDVKNKIIQITKKFKLTDEQTERIVVIPSYRWAKDSLKEIKEKIKDIKLQIKEYEEILKDQNKLKNIYKEELKEIKKAKFV